MEGDTVRDRADQEGVITERQGGKVLGLMSNEKGWRGMTTISLNVEIVLKLSQLTKLTKIW